MEVSQEYLEQQLMTLLLKGDHPILAILRQQYTVAKIASREFTGVGFFLNFDVPQDIPLVDPPNFEAGHISIDLENLPNGAGCILFVREGKLDFLECYTYTDNWPDHIMIKSLSNAHTAIHRSRSLL